ncbi:contractile injection system tape measure protein [Oceanihabitans sp. 2_MG-2023]|uniref:contractile injection system tape measure protein n=1 Tax=Oceanihabitans sp. 2_MG-2023 TaxID=3062661 RepID=UPI0026E1D907|nr:contractile injection system tape measure protein [Oceanihabitans sp. 2_MG-2023]MDO6595310.1 contractile injection system tape measure protein [Oceanihabitans sp. 2_MG-2023]
MKLNEDVFINNAGLVLLNGYFPLLFERLALTKGIRFKNEKLQLQAVHCLQYLATGIEQTEAPFLVLNKLICGLPIETLGNEETPISENQKELMQGLLDAVIYQWTAIGTTSHDGFRKNWFQREGKLSEKVAHWELTVQNRSYDMLLYKVPFSFRILSFPWMLKPLHVNWQY